MTAQDDAPRNETATLENILQTVQAIEENTETILDRFDELLDGREYKTAWHDDSRLDDKDYD